MRIFGKHYRRLTDELEQMSRSRCAQAGGHAFGGRTYDEIRTDTRLSKTIVN